MCVLLWFQLMTKEVSSGGSDSADSELHQQQVILPLVLLTYLRLLFSEVNEMKCYKTSVLSTSEHSKYQGIHYIILHVVQI